MGKSNDAAFLGSSAGARLITTQSCGRTNPELTIARSTRCVLSLTAASGSPTSTVVGNAPAETSTSTSTGTASIPSREKVCSFANIRRLALVKGTTVVHPTARRKTRVPTF